MTADLQTANPATVAEKSLLAGWQELAQRALLGSRGSRPGTVGSAGSRSRPSSPFLERLQSDLLERKRRLKARASARICSPACLACATPPWM